MWEIVHYNPETCIEQSGHYKRTKKSMKGGKAWSTQRIQTKLCAPSPTLFNLCIAKAEKFSSQEQVGGRIDDGRPTEPRISSST
jgi:hypothetical protein